MRTSLLGFDWAEVMFSDRSVLQEFNAYVPRKSIF